MYFFKLSAGKKFHLPQNHTFIILLSQAITKDFIDKGDMSRKG